MLQRLACVVVLLLIATPAQADRYKDCDDFKKPAEQLLACSQIIESGENESAKRLGRAYYMRGSHYHNKGQWKLAIADLTRAIEMDPDYAFSYGRRGEAFLNQGNFERAIADLSTAISMKPKYFMPRYHRAFAHVRTGDQKRALADFQAFMERMGANTPGLYLGRGNVWALKGDHERAIADFDRAIERQPKQFWAYRDRGMVYAKMGQREQAEDDFAEARAIRPGLWVPDLDKPETTMDAQPAKGKDHEVSFWESVRNSNDKDMLQAYIDEFPNGTFVPLAKIKLKKIQTER